MYSTKLVCCTFFDFGRNEFTVKDFLIIIIRSPSTFIKMK